MPISKVQPMRPAEIELVDLVNTLEGNLENEITDRENADKQLQQNIDNEAKTRATNDTTLQNNINKESQDRVNGDNTLQQNIETTKKELQTSIQNEAKARNEEDVQLQKNIDSVQSELMQVDTQLNNKIDDFINTLEWGVQNSIEVIADNSTVITVDFTKEKQSEPIVLITLESTEEATNSVNCYAALTDVSTSNFHVRVYNLDKTNTHTLKINWLAIGE